MEWKQTPATENLLAPPSGCESENEMDQSSGLSRPVNYQQLDAAIVNSQLTFMNEELERNLVAKQAHNSDLYKTQQFLQGNEEGDVLVLVSFPAFISTQSCQKSTFKTARVILTRDQILTTGSVKLEDRLNNASHQRRAKREAGTLPHGVTHVLDLSPSGEEDDYTIALQLLSLTPGIKLWYRASAFGASLEAVAAHDDACKCKEGYDTAYPIPSPPLTIQGEKPLDGLNFAAFLLDTETWSVEDHHDIDDFCQVRQGANVLRLFRSLANCDLQIDSAPRMWTLVGLFSMFDMTNYDLIRDHVVTWFNAGNNYIFVEILPEETLRIASIIRAPVLAFAAFRILVNEHALVIAGDHVRGEQARKNTTIFGRRISGSLSGTEQLDTVMRMVEHAGVSMAERYKQAVDDICGPNALAILDVPEWNQLTLLDQVIPSDTSLLVRKTYDALLDAIRAVILRAVTKCIDKTSTMPPNMVTREKFFSHAAKSRWDSSEMGLSYLVSKKDYFASQNLSAIFTGLNKYQRSLCPFGWLEMRDLFITDLIGTQGAYDASSAFFVEFQDAKKKNLLLTGSYPYIFDIYDPGFYKRLFEHAVSNLSAYGASFAQRPDSDFGYTITQHMVLNLSEKEMDYLRFEDETVYETDIPEAELGPTGPGPSYHTGITVPSVSDSVVGGMDDMAIRSDDGTSTVVGSVVVQDGISTVFDRNRVLTPSASLPSERFTDDAMSADFAEAEIAVPAEHQWRGKALADYVESSLDGADDDGFAGSGGGPHDGIDDDEDDDDIDSEAFVESDFAVEDGDDDDEEDDMEIISLADAAEAAGKRPQDG